MRDGTALSSAVMSLSFCAKGALVFGCSSLEVRGELQSGRRAWFAGDNETALAYFQSAAHKDPNYVYGSVLRQGTWRIVQFGRANTPPVNSRQHGSLSNGPSR